MGRKLPVKRDSALVRRAPRSVTAIGRALRKIQRFKSARKIGKRAREIEQKGIKLDLFDTLDFLEKISSFSKEAEQLHTSLVRQIDASMDAFRDPSMRAYKQSERIPLEDILRKTKTFIESPEGLKSYSRYQQRTAKEIASGGLGMLGQAAAQKHYKEAVAARLASMRKQKRLPKKGKQK